MLWNDENLVRVLKGGGVAVMPTDTIYGIVGSALNTSVVNRIYDIRKRAPEKPCIILISDVGELEKFSITLSAEQKEKLREYWLVTSETKGFSPVSIVLDCADEKFSYLHRGTNSLAFRIPHSRALRGLLVKSDRSSRLRRIQKAYLRPKIFSKRKSTLAVPLIYI